MKIIANDWKNIIICLKKDLWKFRMEICVFAVHQSNGNIVAQSYVNDFIREMRKNVIFQTVPNLGATPPVTAAAARNIRNAAVPEMRDSIILWKMFRNIRLMNV